MGCHPSHWRRGEPLDPETGLRPYDKRKARVPSWTDRVLWRSFPDAVAMANFRVGLRIAWESHGKSMENGKDLYSRWSKSKIWLEIVRRCHDSHLNLFSYSMVNDSKLEFGATLGTWTWSWKLQQFPSDLQQRSLSCWSDFPHVGDETLPHLRECLGAQDLHPLEQADSNGSWRRWSSHLLSSAILWGGQAHQQCHQQGWQGDVPHCGAHNETRCVQQKVDTNTSHTGGHLQSGWCPRERPHAACRQMQMICIDDVLWNATFMYASCTTHIISYNIIYYIILLYYYIIILIIIYIYI